MKRYEAFRNRKISARELHAILKNTDIQLTPPVDIEGIIQYLDIEIDTKPNFKKMKVLGSININNSKPIIWVNRMANQMEERKRFTLAHELGHYMLHIAPLTHWENTTGFSDNKIGFNRDDEWNHEEMEANGFAAQLLMPSEYVKKEFEELSGSSIQKLEKLASIFYVSKLAMKYRLETLGLIS